ncbi:MAG: hypothetical protein JXB47_19900 [Anaerolineae bacterium]|nr:hypothetical protein [Anaerolineae bacterium]
MKTTERSLAGAIRYAAWIFAAAYLIGKVVEFVQWVLVSAQPLPFEFERQEKESMNDE